MTKRCLTCGHVGEFAATERAHMIWSVGQYVSSWLPLAYKSCGPLVPFVLREHRPGSVGALVLGAKL